ncbi:MAG: sulfite oxidase [Chloroflexota bacterium]
MNINEEQKDENTLVRRGKAAFGTKPEVMQGYITPNTQFFVYSNGDSPEIDITTYRLRIEGDGVERPFELSYEELLQLPSHSVIAYVECAGNQRQLFEEVMGGKLESNSGGEMTPWMFGAMGNAVWVGVRLSTLLDMAGVKSDVVDVNAIGLDIGESEGGVNRPMSINKAMDPDTIVAYFMNGEPLPLDNGFPLRLIVPGWIGSNWIKWLGSIHVSTEKIWTHRNTQRYVLMGEEWSSEDYSPAIGGEITTQNIKSSVSLPWKAELKAGKQLIRGIARSPHATIAHVEWSVDEGQTWHIARLVGPNIKYSWTRFEFEWDAPAGRQIIMTRATDTVGNVQPHSHPFNQEGYLFNSVYPHPVFVSEE